MLGKSSELKFQISLTTVTGHLNEDVRRHSVFIFREVHTSSNHRMVCLGRDSRDHLVPKPSATDKDAFY